MANNPEVSSKSQFMKWFRSIFFLTLGAVITGFALETFLVQIISLTAVSSVFQ